MNVSTAHNDAVVAACRIPALNARLALLASADATRSTIAFFDNAQPADADTAEGATAIVTIELTQAAGTVDEGNFQILLDTPIEEQVNGADPVDGSVPTWARIYTPDGSSWADVTVTVEGDGGEIQLVQTGVDGGSNPEARLFNGAFARIASASIQG